METVIKFNSRGTIFSLPKSKLEKYPHTLLNLLTNNIGIPVDKINEAIYIDVSPLCIKHIINYYNIGKYNTDDYFVLMDLRYLNLHDEPNKLPFNYALHDYKNEPSNVILNELSKYKYCRIHTADNKIIFVSLGSYDDILIEKLDKMFYVKNQDFIDCVDGYVCISEKIMNIILSIMRDGINSYYKYLADTTLHTTKPYGIYPNNYINIDIPNDAYMNISSNINISDNTYMNVPNNINIMSDTHFGTANYGDFGLPFPKFPYPKFPYQEPSQNNFLNKEKIKGEICAYLEQHFETRIKEELINENKKKRFKKNKNILEYLKLYGFM